MNKRLMHYGIPPIIIILLFIPITLAVQPSEQYTKIYLNPFYNTGMTQNIWYNYTVDVQSPDGMSNIKSAIITLDAWINPTRTFNVKINNEYCNTKNYTVSTTYASAGRAVITFDCSNVIQMNKINNISIQVSGGNIGSSTAFIELTYTNKPIGELKLHGTEYIAGDDGKMFLQFLDADYQPVNNSECFLSVWYPNSSVMLNNTLMSHLSEGIYFKNFIIPNVLGVYPASAKCYRPLTFYNSIIYNYTYDGFESNTWTGGTGWSTCPLGDPDCQNGWDYETTLSSIVTNATAGTGGCYRGNYCAKYTGSYGFIERGFPETLLDGTKAFNITYAVKFSGFQTGETIEVYIFDGNWHVIKQINLAGGYSNNVWYTFSYYADDSEYNIQDGMLLGFYTLNMPSTGDLAYVDEVAIHAVSANITFSNETDYQILRGSGEVHVSGLFNQLNFTLSGATPAQIWNYTNRTLTYYNMTDTTNYTLINDSIQNAKNDTNNLILTVNQSLSNKIVDINQSINANIDYTRANLTTRIDILDSDMSGYFNNLTIQINDLLYNLTQEFNNTINYIIAIPSNVWNYINRNLTYYEHIDMTNYTRIDDTIYAVNESIINNDNSNAISLSNNMFTYYNNTLYEISNVPFNVWYYNNRTLTYYPSQMDLTNYSLINEGVWTYANRNLTYYEVNNISAQDVWNYINRTLTYYEVNNITTSDIWTYNNRTLTYYPSQTDLTNYTMITEDVWNYTGRYTHGVILD